MAVASCAEIPALIDAWSLAARASENIRQRDHFVQTPSVSTCRISCKLVSNPPAMLFQRGAYLVETVKRGLVQTTCLRAICSTSSRSMVPVFGSRHSFSMGVDARSTTSGWQRAQVRLDRHAGRTAIALAIVRRGGRVVVGARRSLCSVRLGEICEIAIKVPAQVLGEAVPARFSTLDGRFGEPPLRPAIDCSRAGIPRPRHKAPGGVVSCQCSCLAGVHVRFFLILDLYCILDV